MASKLQAVAPQLWSYWTKGKGLARWGASPSPYRTLVAQLKSEGVPAGMVKGLAARIYHAAKGVWPGGKGKGRKRAAWTGAEHRAAVQADDEVRCVVCGAVATHTREYADAIDILVCDAHLVSWTEL